MTGTGAEAKAAGADPTGVAARGTGTASQRAETCFAACRSGTGAVAQGTSGLARTAQRSAFVPAGIKWRAGPWIQWLERAEASMRHGGLQ